MGGLLFVVCVCVCVCVCVTFECYIEAQRSVAQMSADNGQKNAPVSKCQDTYVWLQVTLLARVHTLKRRSKTNPDHMRS